MFKIVRQLGRETKKIVEIPAQTMSHFIDKELRIDVCTTKQEHEEFYKTAGEAFMNSTISVRYMPDVEKRKLLLPAYFRYLHEKQLVTGKGILMALKKLEHIEGEEIWKTVYSGVYAYDSTPTEEDTSEMMDIYKEGAEAMIKRDIWFEEHIDGPLREVAKSVGSAAWLLARQATTKEYRRQNYGFKYGRVSTDFALERGIKKYAEKGVNFKIPPFEYVAFSDTFPGGMEFIEKSGFYPAAHLHYDYKPGLKCYIESPGKYDRSEYSCYFIMVRKTIHPVLKEALRKRFDNKAKL